MAYIDPIVQPDPTWKVKVVFEVGDDPLLIRERLEADVVGWIETDVQATYLMLFVQAVTLVAAEAAVQAVLDNMAAESSSSFAEYAASYAGLQNNQLYDAYVALVDLCTPTQKQQQRETAAADEFESRLAPWLASSSSSSFSSSSSSSSSSSFSSSSSSSSSESVSSSSSSSS